MPGLCLFPRAQDLESCRLVAPKCIALLRELCEEQIVAVSATSSSFDSRSESRPVLARAGLPLRLLYSGNPSKASASASASGCGSPAADVTHRSKQDSLTGNCGHPYTAMGHCDAFRGREQHARAEAAFMLQLLAKTDTVEVLVPGTAGGR